MSDYEDYEGGGYGDDYGGDGYGGYDRYDDGSEGERDWGGDDYQDDWREDKDDWGEDPDKFGEFDDQDEKEFEEIDGGEDPQTLSTPVVEDHGTVKEYDWTGRITLGGGATTGPRGRVSKALQQKEEIFEQQLAGALNNENIPPGEINQNILMAKSLPRFWTKNIDVLVAALKLQKSNPVDPKKSLAKLAKESPSNIEEKDIYRYYRMLVKNKNI